MRDLNRLLYDYYIDVVNHEGIFIKKDYDAFLSLIQGNYFDVETNDQVIRGFMVVSKTDQKYYITMLYGDEQTRTLLFNRFLKRVNPLEIWIHFFNPDALAWYPKPNITHPCFQGVLADSPSQHFYKNLGFTCHSTQETYYQSLDQFEFTENQLKLKKNHLTQDILYDFYDAKIHHGFFELFDALNAPHWKKVMIENANSKNPLNVLIVSKANQVIGFAGPLKVEDSMRGYFAGIGVHPSHRGQKIGQMLFLELCQRLKDIGAHYMTLFTGIDNPAKHMYLKAGFSTVSKQHTMVWLSNRNQLF